MDLTVTVVFVFDSLTYLQFTYFPQCAAFFVLHSIGDPIK